jgi:hypothetical protein
MSDPTATDAIGRVLESQFGLEKANNTILYDGASGRQMDTTIFMGPVFAMRLKHMTEDKWNARAEGRREQKTRQPTGGRGQQGGLRIGEMERDGLAAHGITDFLRESLMERADKTQFRVCNGCGTVPITNESQGLLVCPLCDGPVSFIGTNSTNIEILPTTKKSLVTTSVVEMPYATKLLADELQTYMNMGLRILTAKGLTRLGQPNLELPAPDEVKAALAAVLPERVLPETRVPEFREAPKEAEPAQEDLYAMGVIGASDQAQAEAQAESEYGEPEYGAPEPFAVADFTPLTSTPDYAPMTPPDDLPDYAPMTPPGAPQGMTPPGPPQGMTPPGAPQGITPPGPPLQSGGYQPLYYQVPQQQQMPQMQMPMLQQVPQMLQQVPQMLQQVPQMQMQMIQQGGQYSIPHPLVYSSPVPHGQPTIVVDTSARAMQQGGYLDTYQDAAIGQPVMGRRQTPRGRATSPKKGFGDGPIAPSTKVTVSKLG